MADKEEGPPKHIEEFYKKDKKIDILEARTLRSWGEAHNSASKDVIGDDLSKLNDKDTRKKFTKKVSEYLLSDAKKYFKMESKEKGDKKEDAILNARIMKAYAGTTQTELDRLVEEHKDNYGLQLHNQVADQSVRNIIGELRPIAYDHLESEHTSDIAKHVGLDDDALPELTHKSGLGKLLRDYDKNGHIGKRVLEKIQEDPRRYVHDLRGYIND